MIVLPAKGQEVEYLDLTDTQDKVDISRVCWFVIWPPEQTNFWDANPSLETSKPK